MSAAKKLNVGLLDTLRAWMVANGAVSVTADGVSMVLDPMAFPREDGPEPDKADSMSDELGPHARIRAEHAAKQRREEEGDE